MTGFQISLPDFLKDVVEKRALQREFASPDAYIESLIVNDLDSEIPDAPDLEAELIRGIESGPATALPGDFWVKRAEELERTGRVDER